MHNLLRVPYRVLGGLYFSDPSGGRRRHIGRMAHYRIALDMGNPGVLCRGRGAAGKVSKSTFEAATYRVLGGLFLNSLRWASFFFWAHHRVAPEERIPGVLVELAGRLGRPAKAPLELNAHQGSAN